VGGCREEGRKEMDVLAPKKKRGRDVFFGGVVPPRNIYGLPETLKQSSCLYTQNPSLGES